MAYGSFARGGQNGKFGGLDSLLRAPAVFLYRRMSRQLLKLYGLPSSVTPGADRDALANEHFKHVILQMP